MEIKINQYKKLWIFTLITLFFLNPKTLTSDEIIKIAVGEWPPYISDDLEYYGVISRIITEAFAYEDIKVEYNFFPWKRSLEYVKNGVFDATGIWSKTEERDNFFFYSDPILEIRTVLFYLKSTEIEWENIEDLQDILIGGTIGYNYGELFESSEKEGIITVDRAPRDELNFQKLLKGRIQAFACTLSTGESILKKLYDLETIDKFTYHPKPLAIRYNSLLFSRALPRSESLLFKFNTGLEKLKTSGNFDLYFKESDEGKYKKSIE